MATKSIVVHGSSISKGWQLLMNKQQVFNLIGNRIWIHQIVLNTDPNPMLLTLTGNDEESKKSFLVFTFMKTVAFQLPQKLASFLANLLIGILMRLLKKSFLLIETISLSSGQACHKNYLMVN